MQKATRQHTKEHNTNLVLKTIFDNERIGRAEISRMTRLTRTTVSDIVNDLIDEGLVKEVGLGQSMGGKSPILLSLEPDARYLIGLDLGRKKFSGAIVNLRGEIRYKVDHDIQGLDDNAALASVYAILDQLTQTTYQPLVGIGIGTPGLVNTNDGVVVNAVNLDWKNLQLAKPLRDKYHLPVMVFNDSHAAAMGEFTFSEGQAPESSMIVINLRYGVGAGIIINGNLFHGDSGGAGEIGHVVVQEGGLPCRCGNFGCLETVASTQAVIARAQILTNQNMNSVLSKIRDEITLDTIEQAFNAGDPLARQIILQSGHYLGIAISSLIGALNINRIILVGELPRFGEPWLNAIRQAVRQTTLSILAEDAQIEIGRPDPNGIILGASALILQNYSLLFSTKVLTNHKVS
jgi:N-acetylglucosamine repressor